MAGGHSCANNLSAFKGPLDIGHVTQRDNSIIRANQRKVIEITAFSITLGTLMENRPLPLSRFCWYQAVVPRGAPLTIQEKPHSAQALGIQRHLEYFLARAVHLRVQHRGQRFYFPLHIGRAVVERRSDIISRRNRPLRQESRLYSPPR